MPVPQASAAQPMRPSRTQSAYTSRGAGTQQGTGRHVHVLEHQPAHGRRPQPHRGLGLDAHAARPGFEDEQRGRALERGGDHEQLGARRARNERLHPVQHEAAVDAARRGAQVERVEQRAGFEQGQCRRRHVVADERGQVGGLLLGVAPQHERVRDGGGGQAGDREAHVAVGERLGDQRAGGDGPLAAHPAERLGHAELGDARAR